jgi:hypothetical protein
MRLLTRKEIKPMTTPQTSSAASPGSNEVNGALPADVLTFAAASQVKDCLQPLLEATHRIFPTARSVKVQIDDDDRHILLHVQVPMLSLEQSRTMRNQWIEELFPICSPERSWIFRLRLDQR